MCVIVDPGTLPAVFSEKHKKHKDFSPIKNWIKSGSGKLVYGGSRYKSELEKMPRYLSIVNELNRGRKVVHCDSEMDKRIDQIEQEVADTINSKDFDDPHLVAIVRCLGVRIVCSEDKRKDRYLKRKELYPKGIQRPKLYSSAKHHSKMLNDANIAPCCID